MKPVSRNISHRSEHLLGSERGGKCVWIHWNSRKPSLRDDVTCLCHIRMLWVTDFTNYRVTFSIFIPYPFFSPPFAPQARSRRAPRSSLPMALLQGALWQGEGAHRNKAARSSQPVAGFPEKPTFCRALRNPRIYLCSRVPFCSQWHGSKAFHHTLREGRVPSPCSRTI